MYARANPSASVQDAIDAAVATERMNDKEFWFWWMKNMWMEGE